MNPKYQKMFNRWFTILLLGARASMSVSQDDVFRCTMQLSSCGWHLVQGGDWTCKCEDHMQAWHPLALVTKDQKYEKQPLSSHFSRQASFVTLACTWRLLHERKCITLWMTYFSYDLLLVNTVAAQGVCPKSGPSYPLSSSLRLFFF